MEMQTEINYSLGRFRLIVAKDNAKCWVHCQNRLLFPEGIGEGVGTLKYKHINSLWGLLDDYLNGQSLPVSNELWSLRQTGLPSASVVIESVPDKKARSMAPDGIGLTIEDLTNLRACLGMWVNHKDLIRRYDIMMNLVRTFSKTVEDYHITHGLGA